MEDWKVAKEIKFPISLEAYVGEDVLHGEKEIPFYVIWDKDHSVEAIDLSLDGFARLIQLYNVKDTAVKSSIKGMKIRGCNLKTNGYLGGLLEPGVQQGPFMKARMNVKLHLSDGQELSTVVNRIVFSTTIAGVKAPKVLTLPTYHPIALNLEGSSTVLIEIENQKDGDINLSLPKEIETAFKEFSDDFFDELQKIRSKYPQYESLFKQMIEPSPMNSFSDMMNELRDAMRDASRDSAFMEDLKTSLTAAVMFRLLDRSSIFFVLSEYFESRATDRAFLVAPLLVANVPRGESRLSLKITLRNVLGDIIGSPTIARCKVMSKETACVPLKELIIVRRRCGGNG